MAQELKILVNGSVIGTCSDSAQGISEGRNFVGKSRATYGQNALIEVKTKDGNTVSQTRY